MLFQNSIGINIRDDGLAIVNLKTSLKGIQEGGHLYQPLDPEIRIEQKLPIITGAINDFLGANKITAAEIFVCIPSELAIQRIIELPAAAAENLSQTLRYEMEKYVPIPVDELYFDTQIVFEDQKANRLRVLLLVIKKDVLAPFIALGHKIGKGIGGIEIEATALTSFLTSHSDLAKHKPYLSIVRVGDCLQLSLLKNGRLQVSRKCHVGLDSEQTLNALADELSWLKDRYELGTDALHIGTDGIDLGPTAVERLSTAVDARVDISPIPTVLTPSGRFAAAHGLAIRGLRKLPVQVNFLPLEHRKKPNKFGYHLMIVLAVGVLIAAIFMTGSLSNRQRLTAKRIEDRLASLKADAADINETEADIEILKQQVDQLLRIHQDYVPVVEIIKELTEIVPDDAWLDGLTINGEKLQISGLAKSASGLVESLEASPMFRDVAFLSAITKDKNGKEKFRIGLETK